MSSACTQSRRASAGRVEAHASRPDVLINVTTFPTPEARRIATISVASTWLAEGQAQETCDRNTRQLTTQDADLVEAQIKIRLRHEAHGIALF
jgi:hypothetical protein